MSFSGISSAASSVASMVHAQYAEGVLHALGNMKEIKMMDAFKVGIEGEPAVDSTFKLITDEGFNSVLNSSPSSRSLPGFDDVGFIEGKYRLKEMNSVLEFGLKELKYLDQAMRSGKGLSSGAFTSASDFVATVINAKVNVMNHRVMTDIFGDGTGVVGTISSIDKSDIANGNLVLTLSDAYNARGSTTFMRLGASIVVAEADATLMTFTGVAAASATRLHVVDFDKLAHTVTCKIVGENKAVVTGLTDTSIAATHLCYFGSKTLAAAGRIQIPDLSGAIGDYDLISDHLCGLRSIISADGRLVQGLTRSGQTKSIVLDYAGAAIDAKAFPKLINRLGARWNGYEQFKFKKFIIADHVLQHLIDSSQSDRRIVASNQAYYGATQFEVWEGQSGQQGPMLFVPSVFCPEQDIMTIPEKGDAEVSPLVFAFEDPQSVFDGSEGVAGHGGFLPKPNSAGYDNAVLKYEELRLGLYSKMPAGLGKITHFALS